MVSPFLLYLYEKVIMKRIILTEAKLKKLMVEMKFNQDIVFVSYLPEKYDIKKFKGIEYDWQAQMNNKCRNGLWACPIDSNWGWEKWCRHENTTAIDKMKHSFFFKLKPGAKIYSIDNINDLKKISTTYQHDDLGRIRGTQKKIDFNKLLSNGYDGIYASENAVTTLRNGLSSEMDELYTWDVESICIFNPNVIVPIGEDELMDKMPKYSDVRNHDKWGLYSDEFDWKTMGNQTDNPNRVTHYGDDKDSWDLIDSYYNAANINPPGEGKTKALKANDVGKAWREHEEQEKKRKAADKRSMTNTLKTADKKPLIQKKQ